MFGFKKRQCFGVFNVIVSCLKNKSLLDGFFVAVRILSSDVDVNVDIA